MSSPRLRIFDLIRAERGDLAVAVVYSVAIGLLSLALPVAVQALVNTVAFGSVLQPVVILSLLVAAALLAAAVLHTLRTVVLETMQRRIFVRQASDVLDNLLRFRVGALEGQHAPEMVNRFLDVATVQKSAPVLVIDGLTVLMQTAVGVCLLAAYHPYLLVFDVVLVAAMLVVIYPFGRGAVTSSIEESKAKYAVLAWLEEVARHSVAMRSAAGRQLAMSRADELTRDYLRRRSRHFRVLLRQVAGSQLLQAAALSSLLGIGAYLVIRGELTLGQLIAAELVVSLAVGSFAKLGKSLETFYDLEAALDKLGHLTEMPVEREDGGAAGASGPAAVRMSGVKFGYDATAPLLNGIELDAAPGAKIAIHGRGAAGKSTLLDLLFGLRDPDGGRMELDGVDYRHVALEDLRNRAMLVRGTEIFPGTIEENIAMGRSATAEEVREALQKAGVLAAVNALPGGLSTRLNAAGRPLSPSQVQRLTFARAILHRPGLLLIDEALDTIDDLRIDGDLVRTLFDAHAPWTLIVATERAELWSACGCVYGLEDGRLRTEAVRG